MSRLLAALKHSMVNIVEKGEFVILYFILCFGFGAMSREGLSSRSLCRLHPYDDASKAVWAFLEGVVPLNNYWWSTAP